MSGTAPSVYQAFAETAARYSDRPVLKLVADTARRYGVSPHVMSYSEAAAAVEDLIRRYAALGLSVPGRVALGLDNRPEAFLHWLALNALGVSVVPLNPQWKAAELEYVLDHSDVQLAVGLTERVELMRDAAATLDAALRVATVDAVASGPARDPAPAAGDTSTECALLYTSGTTGRPKGCMLSNEYFLACGNWYRNIGGFCELVPGEDTLITPLPMYHMNAMATSTMGMLLTGGCIVPLDRFHPATFWQSVAESGATILHYLGVMPVMLMGMPEAPHDRAHKLRFGFGAGLSGELHTQFETRFGFKLVEAWAMTETGCTVAIIASREPRKVGTACFGFAPEHIDFRLVDDGGRDVTPGTPGELLIRRAGDDPRSGFFTGYLKDPDATDTAWQGGFFHTGDLVYQDDDGAFHFVDRKKNVIRRSGENIAAVEVEEVLMEHPAVKAVGVAAVPDDVRGDEVFACVVADIERDDWPGVSKDIVGHCLDRLAYYKAPAYLARVDTLPLTPTEKIQRAELKQLAAGLLADGRALDLRAMKSGSSRGG